MTHQSKLIKSVEEKIKFAPNDGGSEIPQHTETARDIVKMVLEYTSEHIAFEASMRDAISRELETLT